MLSLWRLEKAVNSDDAKAGPPVLMVHALDEDMMEWVIARPEHAHAFVLAR